MTGLADRSHLLSPQVNLDTHVADVVNLIRWEELTDVVLCGHSYSGCVISGVAEQIPERLYALVYLDAFVLESGQSLHDAVPPEVRDAQPFRPFHALAKAKGWKTLAVASGHDVMLDRPDELTAILLDAAP